MKLMKTVLKYGIAFGAEDGSLSLATINRIK